MLFYFLVLRKECIPWESFVKQKYVKQKWIFRYLKKVQRDTVAWVATYMQSDDDDDLSVRSNYNTYIYAWIFYHKEQSFQMKIHS
jgi:hypothetical protein